MDGSHSAQDSGRSGRGSCGGRGRGRGGRGRGQSPAPLAAMVAVKLEEPGLSRYVTAIAAAVLKRSQSPLLSRICLGRKHWASESR
jgi:hypothetical protein